MKYILPVIVLCLCCLRAYSQSVPETDIYLAEMSIQNGKVVILNYNNVTKRPGYDNQPAFTPDGSGFLYTSMRSGQTDIYFYDLRSQASVQQISTPESEYSPILTPDGKYISTVRVEKDGTQRLWKFNTTNLQQASLVLGDVKPVGYYVWANYNCLALFVLGNQQTGEANSLYVANTKNGKAQKVESSIGRSLHTIPTQPGRVSYIHKASDTQWFVKSLDVATLQTAQIIPTLPGGEDIAWTKEGILLATQGAKLYQWNPQADTSWVEVADFTQAGAKQISRIAVNTANTLIAIVVQ